MNTDDKKLKAEPVATALSPHAIRALAVKATVHPVTLARYLAGVPVRSTCRVRIERALRTAGAGRVNG